MFGPLFILIVVTIHGLKAAPLIVSIVR